jgi:C-methyltransferase-like protein
VWGAGAKGATFVNLTDPNKEYISCLVDINPKKQGRYIAKTGHSIISPAQLSDFEGERHILVMNDNYYQEIQKEIKGKHFKLYSLGAIL